MRATETVGGCSGRGSEREQQKPWGSSDCGSEWSGLDIVGGHGWIQESEQVMEGTIEGSCSRQQEPELPHGFCCSPRRRVVVERRGQALIVEGQFYLHVGWLLTCWIVLFRKCHPRQSNTGKQGTEQRAPQGLEVLLFA